MPIKVAAHINPPTREQYYELDHAVTGIAFEIQNEFGRILDEAIYQNELALRCRGKGLGVEREVEIQVTHGEFTKKYFLDLLVNGATIVEAKCVESLLPVHQAQLLNYLFLCDLTYGTLLNFRSPKVERQFITAGVSAADRRKIKVNAERWSSFCPEMEKLRVQMLALLDDWGGFLSTELYTEALASLLGLGEEPHRVDVYSGSTIIGTQPTYLLTNDVAFHVTGLERPAKHESQLTRFLTHTKLKAIAWINLHHTNVSFQTIYNR